MIETNAPSTVTEPELPGKNARAMLPLLEELADRDAEIERLRSGITFAASWIESGRSIDGLAARMREMLVPNAEVSGAGTASAGLPGYAAGGNGEQK